MFDTYKQLVREAWKSLETERYDTRGFVQSVKDLKVERDRLYLENLRLKQRLDD